MARDFLGSGLSLPLRVDRSGDMVTSSESDQVKESLRAILGTKLGERRMQPTFGSRLHFLVFEDATDSTTQDLMREYTIEAVRLWEPRVAVINVALFNLETEGKQGVAIMLNYVEVSTNTPDSLVYPFYLNQGV